MNYIENNKLIVKFMGLFNNRPITDSLAINMEYQTSWDRLMPVIERIGRVDFDYEPLANVSLYTPIEIVYQEVVETIKSYYESRGNHD